jgi:hypothetical protein
MIDPGLAIAKMKSFFFSTEKEKIRSLPIAANGTFTNRSLKH